MQVELSEEDIIRVIEWSARHGIAPEDMWLIPIEIRIAAAKGEHVVPPAIPSRPRESYFAMKAQEMAWGARIVEQVINAG